LTTWPHDNPTSTTTTSTWQRIMHVVPIRASSPQLIEHRLSTWYEWLSIHRSIKPQLYIWMTMHWTGHQAPNFNDDAWTQQQYNNNQQIQRHRQLTTLTTLMTTAATTTTYNLNDIDDNSGNDNKNDFAS
jgi:hypothetical protein